MNLVTKRFWLVQWIYRDQDQGGYWVEADTAKEAREIAKRAVVKTKGVVKQYVKVENDRRQKTLAQAEYFNALWVYHFKWEPLPFLERNGTEKKRTRNETRSPSSGL